MYWNDHKKLEGTHAFLGASTYSWINWTDTLFEQRFKSQYSTTIGTAIHELASKCIKSRIKLNPGDVNLIKVTLSNVGVPKSVYNAEDILTNLIPFVNDSIGYHMQSEIVLYYSMFCYGTTDAIGYDEKNKILRVHDYKSGANPAKIEQLHIYTALFCLEYHIQPKSLRGIENRIYQNFEVLEDFPTAETIEKYMELIKSRSEMAQKLYERDIE